MRRPSLPGSRALLFGWLIALALARSGTITERDPYWQARAGAENLAGVPLARPDAWTWAPVDDLFRPTSPGWNLVLGAGWQSAGFWGIFLVSLLTIAAYLWVTLRLADALGARPLPALLALLPVFLLGIAWFSPRATLAAQTLIGLALLLPVWWWPRARASRVAVNAAVAGAGGFAVSWLGNATHLSWMVVALGMSVAWTVFWLLVPDLTNTRRAALSLAGALGLAAGVLTTPYGVTVGLAHTAHTQESAAGIIKEWMPVTAPGLPAIWLLAALVGLSSSAGLLWWVLRGLRRRRRDLPLALGAAIAVLAIPAAVAGFLAMRFLGTSLLLLAPVLAAALTRAAGRIRLPGRFAHWTSGRSWRIVLTWTLVVLSPAIVLQTIPHSVPAEAAIAERLPSGCHLFSDDGTGGAVILLRPDVPVWVDGRSDYYGRERLLAASRFLAGRGVTTVPEGTSCVVLPTSQPALAAEVARLDADSAWERRETLAGFTLWLPRSP